MLPYSTPRIMEERCLAEGHLDELARSAIDFQTAAFGGVSSISHAEAYDIGIRGDGDLGGLVFRYWDPRESRFSTRMFRLKPDRYTEGRKYIQPVGERPRFFFIPGTTQADLEDSSIPVFLTEGEKKALSLNKALLTLDLRGVVIAVGGVWGWRCSPRELQPDGRLGKGRSRPIEGLEVVTWSSRIVYIAFDSDTATNWKVAVAQKALAQELARRGARVNIMRIRGGNE